MGKALAFMEQSVAQLIQKAMVLVGRHRIKYPGLSTSQTALLYVVAFLKAHNPTNKPHMTKKYKDKLRQFTEDCSLIPILSSYYKEETSDDQISVLQRYDDLRRLSATEQFQSTFVR